MDFLTIAIAFGLLMGLLLIMRLVGAWMLRIDDVIIQQKKTNKLLEELKEQNASQHSTTAHQ